MTALFRMGLPLHQPSHANFEDDVPASRRFTDLFGPSFLVISEGVMIMPQDKIAVRHETQAKQARKLARTTANDDASIALKQIAEKHEAKAAKGQKDEPETDPLLMV